MSAKKSSKSSKATTAEIIANNRKQITEKFVEMLSDKTLDWVKEWSGASLDGPYNPTSGVRYSGGNRLWLSMIASATGDPRFCTYKQASKRGWQVRKGSHGYLVEKFGPVYIYEKDDDGNIVRDADGRPVIAAKFYKPIATYRVFNFVDIEGVPELVKPEPMAPDAVTELMDAFIDTSDCPVIEGDGDRAFYRPGSDEIHVPSRDCFTNSTAAPSCTRWATAPARRAGWHVRASWTATALALPSTHSRSLWPSCRACSRHRMSTPTPCRATSTAATTRRTCRTG